MADVEELAKEEELHDTKENDENTTEHAPEPTPAAKWKPNFELLNFETSNALLHKLFVMGDYVGCKSLIGKAYYWLARAIYHLDTDLFNTCEKARDLLLQAPGLQSSVELIIFLAKLVSELGDTTAAIQAYERALQSILAAGSIMQAHGDHDVALNKYSRVIEHERRKQRQACL
ncbi:hypothetical protein TELCIR_05620 [Teladorsagia circumcincta]|uniref:Tetratricopeptide repeat protein n=1 Tax=Teladorsagia circumcincta TaxID=45464 RepID=A0A2G9USG2_TELCI|nr:hypothetical protein TELCIR_05620 [Teladorsagia circumcincta]